MLKSHIYILNIEIGHWNHNFYNEIEHLEILASTTIDLTFWTNMPTNIKNKYQHTKFIEHI